MMNIEQQMKDALDGKFFYLTHEGRTECREVPEGFNGQFTTHNFSHQAAREGGLKSAARAKEDHDWTDDEMTLLMYLRRKNVSIRQCAVELMLSRWTVRYQCKRMGI